MGNYYKGNLILRLKKDIPNTIKKDLINFYMISQFCLPQEFEDKYSNNVKEKILKNLQYKARLTICVEDKQNLEDWDFDEHLYSLETILAYENVEDYLEKEPFEIFTPEKFEKALNNYDSIILKLEFNSKQYNNELQDFITCLKPYMVLDHENFLGKLRDEDYTREDYFYLDYDKFLKSKKECDYICNGCDKRPNQILCSDFLYCKRAYDLAKKEEN